MSDTLVTLDTIPDLRHRREIELVLLLTRPHFDGDVERRIEALTDEGIDWKVVREFAWRHRLLSLLYNRLGKLNLLISGPSDLLREDMQHHAQMVSQHNLLLTGELMHLLRHAAAERIGLLPFKGPALAYTLYGNLAVRPFSDLDIFVRREEVVKARKLLMSLGYQPRLHLTDRQVELFLHYEHDLTFVHESTGIVIELHWRFFSRYVAFQLGGEGLWKRLRTAKLAGVEVLTLPPEEHLLLLAVHGAKHLWIILGWILDVAQLIAVEHVIDWEYLENLARSTGSSRTLHLALILVAELFETELPDHVVRGLDADHAAHRLADQVKRYILEEERPEISQLQEHRFYLNSRERMSDRLYYGWWWLFTPNYKDQSFIHLPAALSPLHYAIRPIRLIVNLFKGQKDL